MSAKFLHALADENPDLSRQIGCMTGIFQMFDRQYVITNGRRLPAPPRSLPSGPPISNTSSVSAERVMRSPQILLEKNLSKSWKEPQRASLDYSNSRSSSSSSFSSLDCNHSTNHDLPPLDRILFPEMPLKNSPKLKLSDHDISIDIRDVVKDSINRETRGGLSLKNSSKEGREQKNYYRDSPRPMHLPKKGTGSELDKSRGVFVQLKEASRGPPLELNQPPRLSFDARDGFSRSLTRDVPRLSYDGREAPFVWSRESNDNNPRYSLDSKDAFLLDSNSDSNSNSNSNSVTKGEKIGIVAKLMGLDAMPKSSFGNQGEFELLKEGKISSPRNYCFNEKMPKIPKIQERRKTKGPDLGMKPMTSTRIPIEPAPWKQQEKICIPQKTSYRKRESQVTEQQLSVYSEIEKRLKDLEFEQSNRDLRALKQILDSMHAKGFLEAEKDVTISNSNLRSEQHLKSNKESALATDFKSPIVIMKPAKSVLGMEDAPLAPGIPQLRTSDDGNKKKPPIYNQSFKEQTSRASPRVSSSKRPENRKTEANFKQKIGLDSSSTSPRLQRKKLEMEKRLKPPIPNSNSNKSSKQHTGKNYTDSTSPRNRARRKPAQTEKNYEMLSDASTGYNGDEVSLRSDSTISMASSKVDVEVTSIDKSGDVKNIPSSRSEYQNSKAKSPLGYSNVEIVGCEPTSATPEHLSPVSVLDSSLYHEDVSPPSMRPSVLSRGKASHTVESQNPVESPEKNQPAKLNKMENIQNLLQKLKQLSISEETNTETVGPAPDHIALLCETADPDHRYASEILLASGLLMKDSLEVQLHASGNPINPDLFLVLEQRKSGWVVKPETRVKSDPEKTHRRLVFDLVNELLLQKLDFKAMGVKSINRQVPLGGQKLLREICAEIEELKTENGSSEDESNLLSSKDLMKRSDGWAHFGREVSGIVLDVERSIFKELIDDVVTGEVMHGPKARANRRRKQLFVK